MAEKLPVLPMLLVLSVLPVLPVLLVPLLVSVWVVMEVTAEEHQVVARTFFHFEFRFLKKQHSCTRSCRYAKVCGFEAQQLTLA